MKTIKQNEDEEEQIGSESEIVSLRSTRKSLMKELIRNK